MVQPSQTEASDEADADWRRRVVGRSLRNAAERSVDRGMNLIRAAAAVLERSNGEDITVQDVADEAGQSLRTLYQYFESKDDLLLAVFEEAMRTYARLIEQSISQLTDPMERLAGAMVAAARMPEISVNGFDRGLVRLRLRLSQAKPEMVGRAQSAVTTLVRSLVEAAAATGHIQVSDPDAATFLILSLNAAFITTETIGNDAGVRRPDIAALTSFSLRGLGAELDDGWYDAIGARLRLSTTPSRPAPAGNVAVRRPVPRRRVAKKA
ncbi:MAG: TetR/AcrR family transcriptional regulator [Acidimicrobiales bacterium]